MTYKCEITKQSTRPTVVIRTRTNIKEISQVLGENYAVLGEYLGSIGEFPAGAPFVAYYNIDMQDLDIEIGFPVSKSIPGKDKIMSTEIPGGKVATCLHVGPYQEIEKAYTALTKYIEKQDCEPTDVAYEFYLNDPRETAPQDLKTEIIFPLRT